MAALPFTHLIAAGLSEGEVAAFQRQVERVAPGLTIESVERLDDLDALALFDAGCIVVLPFETKPLNGVEELRRLRNRQVNVPALLLFPMAGPVETVALEELGAVEILPLEGYTAFDLRRALFGVAASRARAERAVVGEERLREIEEHRLEHAKRLEDMSRRLAMQSLDDEMTGLRNERYMLRRVAESVRQSRRHDLPLSCLLVGLDKLAETREKLGGAAGEAMIVSAANKLRHAIRDTDLLSRYGHDEFLILTPLTSAQGAVAAARRLRGVMVGHSVDFDGRALPLGISVGVASFRPEMAGAIELIQLVAEALAQARERGRTGIEVL
ncbi:MAG: GGDEF domain-containing protein [Acidobacteriota bacterium]